MISSFIGFMQTAERKEHQVQVANKWIRSGQHVVCLELYVLVQDVLRTTDTVSVFLDAIKDICCKYAMFIFKRTRIYAASVQKKLLQIVRINIKIRVMGCSKSN